MSPTAGDCGEKERRTTARCGGQWAGEEKEPRQTTDKRRDDGEGEENKEMKGKMRRKEKSCHGVVCE